MYSGTSEYRTSWCTATNVHYSEVVLYWGYLEKMTFYDILRRIKGLSSGRRRREGMQRVQTVKSNMLLNLNLRDVLLRGPRHAHHDNPIAPSCCARRLARALALASSRMHWKCDDRVMTDRQTWTLLRVAC